MDIYHIGLSGSEIPHSGYFFSSSTHLAENFRMPLLHFNSGVILHCVNGPPFLYLFFHLGTLGCFQFLATMNRASVSMAEQVSLWYSEVTFGYIPKSGIAGSWGRSISNFPRNWFPQWLYKFSLPPTVNECSSYSTSSPAWDVNYFVALSHSDKYKMKSRSSLTYINQ